MENAHYFEFYWMTLRTLKNSGKKLLQYQNVSKDYIKDRCNFIPHTKYDSLRRRKFM